MALSKFSVTAKRLADGSVQVIVGVTEASDDVIRSAISDALFHAVDKLGERTMDSDAITGTPVQPAQLKPTPIVAAYEGPVIPMTRRQWYRMLTMRIAVGRVLTREEVLAIVEADDGDDRDG